jgi:hypothetical protein
MIGKMDTVCFSNKGNNFSFLNDDIHVIFETPQLYHINMRFRTSAIYC